MKTKTAPAPRPRLVPVREISLTPSPQGFHLSAMVGGNLVSRHFIGYGKREAVAAFRSLNPIN